MALAAQPPKHAVLPGDARASALLLRGEFYAKVKNLAEACGDYRAAVETAPRNWQRLDEARAALRKNCGD